MRFLLWLSTLLFLVAFFTYGYFLYVRARKRRGESDAGSTDGPAGPPRE